MAPMQFDLIWTLVGLLLTLMIFSYLLGDNPLFRVASYLFVGVAAGYVFVLICYQVILPRLVYPLLQGSTVERVLALVPLILGVLLILRIFGGRFTAISAPSMAYLVGAGAAVVIGGAVMGTLVLQSQAAVNSIGSTDPNHPILSVFEGVLFLIGTASALVYFHFGAKTHPDQTVRRPPWMEVAARIGQVFIVISLGALFAGVYASAVTALVERVGFIQNVIQNLSLK